MIQSQKIEVSVDDTPAQCSQVEVGLHLGGMIPIEGNKLGNKIYDGDRLNISFVQAEPINIPIDQNAAVKFEYVRFDGETVTRTIGADTLAKLVWEMEDEPQAP